MPEPTQSGRQFAFLLVDKFSMFSLAAAIDTVRSANRMLGHDFYSWKTVSPDGETVMAGMWQAGDGGLAAAPVRQAPVSVVAPGVSVR